VTKILGELAWTVKEFESPGAGLAVPANNLRAPMNLFAPAGSRAAPAKPKP
jgi:hypothetical protein